MVGSILILVGVTLVISKISFWKSHIRKEYKLLHKNKTSIQFENTIDLTRGPIASWTNDHWENSETEASVMDDVMVIQNELGKIEKVKSKRLPQVICVGSKKCGTG